MRVKNLSADTIREAVEFVSTDQYGGNVVLENIRQESANFVTFKIGVKDSRGAGARVSAGGRHGRWACTHVFEDVMAQVIGNGGQFHIPGRSPGNPDRGQKIVSSLTELERWADAYNCTNMGTRVEEIYPEMLCVTCEQ